jgi:serine/threonine-protein kinase
VEHGDETDFVKVLDFGLVKNVSDAKGEDLTQTGLFMGSPKYMAPEQIRGDRVDARTDIYSLGVILYEMLTGKVPFDRPTSVNILMAHVNDDAPAMRQMNPTITLSPLLEETVSRCMAKDPEQRFRSMDEVLAALKRVGSGALTGTISGTGEHRPFSSVPPPLYSANASGNVPVLSPTLSEPGSIPSPFSLPPAAPVPLLSPPPPASRSSTKLAAAALGAVAIAAAAGFIAFRATQAASNASALPQLRTVPSAATTVPGAAAKESAAVAAPVVPVLAILRVNSDPDGASVKEDGVELCSSTPCDIPYKGDDADPTKDHRLTLLHSGYRSESRSVKVSDSPVIIKLTPAPAFVGKPAPAKPADTPSLPPGYKPEIPY